ncbi:hypothetical protein BU26DRAFT_564844 [Trematosphaeria pertusa]|uniref:Uncharacterized protein n=1 Tax=Trematosphaeria pertusa TaxID=390896 RepID=A0A6A6IH30_9PLEO|nr:uncharacterized protein BU26DRAFT_564844 [Trematosphaeria pertusa]KAF2249182.1 hypothetical protein BU26DRAFT_564844 [Trematosphaeria pertusa]
MSGEQHSIVVDGVNGPWQQVINVGHFLRYSRGLYELIEADIQRGQGETQIAVPPTLTRSTMERLIRWIDRGVPHRDELTFLELLRLSTAVWHYKCDPGLFARLASIRREQIVPQSDLGVEAAGWTFIALVFGWRGDFEDASRQLICAFTIIDFVDGVPYFPARLRDAIVAARRRLLRSTFRFIKNDVMKYLRRGVSFNHISQSLHDKGIDITLTESEFVQGENNTTNLCPVRMLDILEEVALDRPQEGQPLESIPATEPASGSSTSGSGRETRQSTVSDSSGGATILTLRGDSGVNEGSIRRFVSSYLSRKRPKERERKQSSFWTRDDVGIFETITAELRGRIESRRLELFGGCGLDIIGFQDLRRERLLLVQAQGTA